jgi:poly-gamma-glutamate synthesis protein (capsule biosynthesis protein)
VIEMMPDVQPSQSPERQLTVFLSGDVMTGRGVDQVLPFPGDPELHEQYATSALDYVALAERRNGTIPAPVGFDYPWGDALTELAVAAPHARIVNLETSVTTSEEWEPKGINYRMHPRNVPCLNAAGIDCCMLANNHVLDWGRAGLEETLASLWAAGLATAGAGRSSDEAWAPALIGIPRGRILVFGLACADSGVPRGWAATEPTPGVNLLPDLSASSADHAIARVARHRRRRLRDRLDSLGWQLGIQCPACPPSVRSSTDRLGGGRRGAWALLAPPEGNRGVPPEADPLRLR